MTVPSEEKVHLRGLLYFAIPSNIQGRSHLVGLEFDGWEEWMGVFNWAIGRGYLPALEPQSSPGVEFDARPTSSSRTPGRAGPGGEGTFTPEGVPVCPNHPGGMLESQKHKGGYYCGRKENGQRCGWEWESKRGFYQISAKGAARR